MMGASLPERALQRPEPPVARSQVGVILQRTRRTAHRPQTVGGSSGFEAEGATP
jgi:hypothetical protein